MPDNWSYTHDCETNPTHPLDGRKSCHSSISHTAPGDYFYNDRDIEGAETARRGSCNYSVTFSDFEELIPETNIKYPKTINLYATSRSPKEIGTSGIIEFVVSGTYIKKP